MMRSTNKNMARFTVLALSLLGGSALRAAITGGSTVAGPITFGTAAPGSYGFTDYSFNFQATLVTASMTGVSLGAMRLNTNTSPDYGSHDGSPLGGDRLLLVLTNNTGVSLFGIQLILVSTTFDTFGASNDPSRGTFSSNSYTSDVNQRRTSPDVTINAPTNTVFSVTFDAVLAPGASTAFYLPIADNGAGNGFQLSEMPMTSAAVSQPYYFSQLAFGGGYQTTLTYLNYSPQSVTCVTNFYSDTGSPLPVPFSEGTISSRTDVLLPGQSIHDQSVADLNAAGAQGWAQATCNSPVQASVLYRFYQSGVPVGEAGVNAETAPTTKFVTFAQTATGVAYANPSSTQSATITLTVISTAGISLGSRVITLGPLSHGSANLGPLFGLQSFTGFVEITSSIPIISLSLNAEVFPVFSSLPPGDLPSSTTLVQ